MSTKPEFVAGEAAILDFWEKNEVFAKRVRANRGGPKYSFIDGPITANNKMGVHHAWGRTLKDIYQRYKALQGFDQRYQNGFDCQGLWVEVEVEKALGLNGKPEIEKMGLAEFSRACRERVEKFSGVQLEQSVHLGMWMDWPNNYITMSDANIRYIWHFLKVCHEKGWITRGHKPMPWCSRCGTSLSHHEVSEGYKTTTHKSVYLLFPLTDSENEAVMVWTTTPWTLLANVGAAVHPELDYAKVEADGKIIYLVAERADAVLKKGAKVVGKVKGADLVGRPFSSPFEDAEAQQGVEHKVIPWKEVSTGEGTGIVHIAPGCGLEDYMLGRELGLAEIMPIDESGRVLPGFGDFAGNHASEIPQQVFDALEAKGVLYKVEDYEHSYPHCWRDGSELLFRLVDEWFIDPDKPFGDGRTVREHLLEANRQIEWKPAYGQARMHDWLSNMQSWCISRKRFWGLPLPFYTNEDLSVLHVIGSLEELRELAIEEDKPKVDALEELHRPWIDEIRIQDPQTGQTLTRIPDVGDCWLDAGIVPYSTLGYKDIVSYDDYKSEQDRLNSKTLGREVDSRGLMQGEEWGHEYWEQWFPAEAICEMRAQVRGWFYAMLYMSVAIEDRTPYRKCIIYEDVRDERGEEMHKSKGNAIWFDDAVERAGADTLRWLYAGTARGNSLRFGFGPASEVTRRLMTVWNVYKFFLTYAEIDQPRLAPELQLGEACTPLDRWIASRMTDLIETCTKAYDEYETTPVVRACERFAEDLSNWYVRRNRRRFWKAANDEHKNAGYQVLGHALLTLARVASPIIPMISEQIYRGLQPFLEGDQWPESIHLLDFPRTDAAKRNETLESEIDTVQSAVSAALAARNAANIRVRQPVAKLVLALHGAQADWARKHLEEIHDELNVKDIQIVNDLGHLQSVNVKPNFNALKETLSGEDFKAALGTIKKTPADELLKQVRDGEHPFGEDQLLIETEAAEGWASAEVDGVRAAIDTHITEELKAEGDVRDLIRNLQVMRREAGLRVEQKVRVHLAMSGRLREAAERMRDLIASEVLAEELTIADSGEGEAIDCAGTSVTVKLEGL